MKTLADILIYVAGLLWAIECLPQIFKLLRTRETRGLSLVFFIICLIAYILFIAGNMMLKNYSIVIANSLPFTLMGVIVFLIMKYRRKK